MSSEVGAEPGRNAPCGGVLLYAHVFHSIIFCVARHSPFRVEIDHCGGPAMMVRWKLCSELQVDRARRCSGSVVGTDVHSANCLSVDCAGDQDANKYIFVSKYYWQRCIGRLVPVWLVGSAASEIERSTRPDACFASLYERGCCRPSTPASYSRAAGTSLPSPAPSMIPCLVLDTSRRTRRRHVYTYTCSSGKGAAAGRTVESGQSPYRDNAKGPLQDPGFLRSSNNGRRT